MTTVENTGHLIACLNSNPSIKTLNIQWFDEFEMNDICSLVTDTTLKNLKLHGYAEKVEAIQNEIKSKFGSWTTLKLSSELDSLKVEINRAARPQETKRKISSPTEETKQSSRSTKWQVLKIFQNCFKEPRWVEVDSFQSDCEMKSPQAIKQVTTRNSHKIQLLKKIVKKSFLRKALLEKFISLEHFVFFTFWHSTLCWTELHNCCYSLQTFFQKFTKKLFDRKASERFRKSRRKKGNDYKFE